MFVHILFDDSFVFLILAFYVLIKKFILFMFRFLSLREKKKKSFKNKRKEWKLLVDYILTIKKLILVLMSFMIC